MTTEIEIGQRRRSANLFASWRRSLRVSTALVSIVAFCSGCDTFDELLEVELPGQVVDGDLNDPELAETLVVGAQSELECALRGHLFGIEAGWANSFQYVGILIEMILIANRQDRVVEVGIGDCTSARDPIWFTMHRARTQGANAIRRIEAMPEGSVEGVDLLLAKAYTMEGYAVEHLAEPWCEMVFDGSGAVVSRQDAMRIAEARFSTAIDHAMSATAGPRAAEAREMLNLARVGRARARLNLGDAAGVVEDAGQVDAGFVFYATYDQSPSRRQNMVNDLESNYVVHPTFRNVGVLPDGRSVSATGEPIRTDLSAGAVPDPRVPVQMIGTHSSGNEWWVQRKFENTGSDIPFASWREAQLMIAEVEGGQVAVDIVNQLRATVDELPWVSSDPGLPQFSSSDEPEILATVLEERRRELFLHGQKVGDDLRTGHWNEWDTGTNPVGQQYGDNSCVPLPDSEFF
jgi:hypothetical protein